MTWINDAGGSGTCSGTLYWNASLTLSEGINEITVTASDEAGNTGEAMITVTYDQDEENPDQDPTQAQCNAGMYADYNGGFVEDDIELRSVEVDPVDGKLVLQTGSAAIDLENIVIPYNQEVWVTYIHSGAGLYNDFGWMLESDAVFNGGDIDYHAIRAAGNTHGIFRDIRDGNQTVFFADGIFDAFEGTTEAYVSNFDDNTGYPFMVNWDGEVGPEDHRKSLGIFAGGTEIVFFLASYLYWDGDRDWDDPALNPDWVFYTKKDWNADSYLECEPAPADGSPFDKLYHLDQARPEAPNTCFPDGGWLDQSSIDRLADPDTFNLTLSGTVSMPITPGATYPHAVVGAPADDPKQWIIGFEDINNDVYAAWGPPALHSDMDHNDIVVHIERRTGGTAQLKSDQAITPPNPDAFFTAVTLSVYDKIMDGICLGENSINYFISLDAGANWSEITSWDRVMDFSGGVIGDEVVDWSPGEPVQTYRTRRLDFAGLGLTGRELVWKAVMNSDDDQCVPEIFDIVVEANVAERGTFSRAAPVVVANVLYSGKLRNTGRQLDRQDQSRPFNSDADLRPQRSESE